MPSRVCRDGIQNQVHIFIDLICQREIALSIMENIRKKPKSLIRSFDKTLIPKSCTRLTSCELNLAAKRCNLNIRKNFLSQRVISNWNALPEEIKRARTLKTFKFLCDEHIKNHYGQRRWMNLLHFPTRGSLEKTNTEYRIARIARSQMWCSCGPPSFESGSPCRSCDVVYRLYNG